MMALLLAFIPIFVAIDPFGNIPFFLSITRGLAREEAQKLVWQAIITALFVGLTFGFAGHWILQVMGIAPSDFQIAGGILLFIFSVQEILGSTVKKPDGKAADRLLGVVPLGIPLIAGPALMTTLLILHDLHSYSTITMALIMNLAIIAFLFLNADTIVKHVGEATAKAATKITAIFLAAIGIMMIRKGILAGFFH